MELTEDLLEALELRLHPEKTRIASFEQGFRFLGALFVRSLILPSKQRSMDVAPPPVPADPAAAR